MLLKFHILSWHATAVFLLFGFGNHFVFAVGDVASVVSVKGDATGRPTKPNILIMMADDMGIGDTSAYLDVRLSPASPPVKKHYEHQASGDSQNQRLCSLMAMHLLLCAVQRGTPCSLVVVPTGRTLSIRAGSLTDPTRQ